MFLFHTHQQFLSLFFSGGHISPIPLQQLPLGTPCRLWPRVAATVGKSEDGNMGFARTVASAQGSKLELRWGTAPLCRSCCPTAPWWKQLSRSLCQVSSQHRKKHWLFKQYSLLKLLFLSFFGLRPASSILQMASIHGLSLELGWI